jgi:phage anti-repressor protein
MNFDSFTELHDEFQLAHKDLVPSSLLIAATIQKQRSSIPLKALFDPGSDLTFIHERCIPHGATPAVSSITIGTTLAGTFTTSRVVTLDKILLPEFYHSFRIDSHPCYLINTNYPYDIIVGCDLLTNMRMGFDFDEMTLTAYGKTVNMKPKHFYQKPFAALLNMVKEYHGTDDEDKDSSTVSSYYNTPKEKTESHYEKVDVDAVIEQQKHLSMVQRAKLSNSLKRIWIDGSKLEY